MTKTYDIVVPPFGFAQYWPEIAFLVIAVAAPLIALFGWGSGEAFERAGSLSVFFAAVAEFIALNRLTKKHFLNACRAKEGETPWGISPAASYVGIAAFVIGLAGTLIWGFGSKWV